MPVNVEIITFKIHIPCENLIEPNRKEKAYARYFYELLRCICIIIHMSTHLLVRKALWACVFININKYFGHNTHYFVLTYFGVVSAFR